jgi:hypothetical protein
MVLGEQLRAPLLVLLVPRPQQLPPAHPQKVACRKLLLQGMAFL